MKIEEETAIVTGGASGLGLACAKLLQERGASVFVADIDERAGAAASNDLGTTFVPTDVTDEAQVENLLDQVASTHGPARILVNCVGIAPDIRVSRREGPHSIEAFRQVLETNIVGTFLPISRFAQRLHDDGPTEDETGVIVTTSSITAFDGQAGHAAYSATKAAIAGMTLPIARDLASLGIRIGCIAPGIFDTPMMNDIPNPHNHPLGQQVPFPRRLGKADEFANLVAHIVENQYLNGETIRLDGALRLFR